jgi:hypothetical protein
MPDRDDIRWFKSHFADRIRAAIRGTPYSLDFLVAIACQETGEIWPALRRKGLAEADILALCVGDILDAPNRSAFPRNKAELIGYPGGDRMFEVARAAFVAMATHIRSYRPYIDKPNKFAHGYGIFQRDLQFFKEDPAYFLERRYADFDASLANALHELEAQRRRLGYRDGDVLGILEMAYIGIAYNTGAGNFRKSRGLKQGYKPEGGQYYGENLFDFIRLSETVAETGAAPLVAPPPPGESIVPPPTPVTATGPFYRVDTRVSTLLLRSEPRKSTPSRKNVVGELPDGHPVRAVTGTAIGDYLGVETSLNGALLRGYAATRYLVRAPTLDEIPVEVPLARPTIPAVLMPVRGNAVTRRTDLAGAHSLNEPRQPGRTGTDVDTLRRELAAIIDWLDVANPRHLRYAPRRNQTFCNIYAHDYCHLASVYLPRVWWEAPALLAMQRGEGVEPRIGSTIREMRANDLFHWLANFGLQYGWRQTGSLTKLQVAANQGGVGLIVARRKNDDRSGHIVLVVPETDAPTQRARRNADGEVTRPLQSQAGVENFAYGTPARDWWNGDQFAEFAWWIHA